MNRVGSARPARAVATVILALLAACGREGTTARSETTARESRPAGARATARPMLPPGADTTEWTIPARDYASTRFSELSQIDSGNVRRLRPAWTFSTGVLRGHEAAPIVADGAMYVVTPFPNLLYALDPVTGALKWRCGGRTSTSGLR